LTFWQCIQQNAGTFRHALAICCKYVPTLLEVSLLLLISPVIAVDDANAPAALSIMLVPSWISACWRVQRHVLPLYSNNITQNVRPLVPVSPLLPPL